jgi:hypothetical protein
MMEKCTKLILEAKNILDKQSVKDLENFLKSLKDNRSGKVNWYRAIKFG